MDRCVDAIEVRTVGRIERDDFARAAERRHMPDELHDRFGHAAHARIERGQEMQHAHRAAGRGGDRQAGERQARHAAARDRRDDARAPQREGFGNRRQGDRERLGGGIASARGGGGIGRIHR